MSLNENGTAKMPLMGTPQTEKIYFETDQIDKLFLEISQFTTVKTVNDLKIEELEGIMKAFLKEYDSDIARANALQEVWRVLNG